MKFISILFSCIFIFNSARAQVLTQVVRGTVKNQTSQQSLAGANVSLFQSDQLISGSVTDDLGNFSINEVPPGRYKLSISFTGYGPFEDEVLVISGKEVVISISLQESTTMLNEVTVKSPSYGQQGMRSITIEKTMRIPANFFDPVRMATSYPGVVATNDGSNSIVVKGYSPNGLLWRLEGLDIVNPNHLANAGTFSDKPVSNGGGVNILSAQLLDKTNFYSGSLPVQYGNALSGALDMSLRSGSKEKLEVTAQASLIGLDVAAEGPIGKSKRTSFLANYRYSTVGLLSSMGINFGDEKISFQDFSFHLDSKQKRNGKLSVFGFGGLSSNQFDRKPQDEWEEEKDRYDIDYTGKVFGIGFKEQIVFGKTLFSIGSALSEQLQDRNSQGATVPYQNIFTETYQNNKLLVSSFLKMTTKVSFGGIFETGLMVNYLNNPLEVITITPLYFNSYYPNVSGRVEGVLWQPYANWSQQVNFWKLNAGLRFVKFSYNNTQSVEPRLSVQRLLPRGDVALSYGITSQLQQTQNYLEAGSMNNQFSRAHQLALDFNQSIAANLELVASVYYHQLMDVPVSTSQPIYSTLNQLEDYALTTLQSTGKGRNYGTEISLERKFYNQGYFLLTGSVYNSQYVGISNKYYDSRFSGKFTTSAMGGKEWLKKNKSFGVHGRILYLGGLRQAPINEAVSSIYGTTSYDLQNGYTVKLPNYFRTDLRVSWRKNKPGYTRTISLDIQNVFNTQNVAYRYFDTFLQAVTTKYQLGIIPILVYRVEF